LTLGLSSLMWSGPWPADWLVIGTGREPEVFKKYLTQSILMAMGAYLFALLALDVRSKRQRALCAIAAAICVANVLLMLSGRSGQLILASLALCFAFARWRRRGLLAMCLAFLILAAATIAGSGGAREGAGRTSADAAGTRDGSWTTVPRDFKAWQQGGSANTSTAQRLNYAVNSTAIVMAHPFTGVGTGGFAAAYARQVDGKAAEATVNPHNEYLNIAVQLGLPGLGLLILLLAAGWHYANGLPTLLERDLARGLMVAYATGCMINSMLMDHVEGLFFAWALGVLFGGWRARPQPADR
jgi:O-antigen ligase